MNNEVVTVKTFFASIHIHLSDIWLESCINWCKSEILNGQYTVKELQTKVYEQWLLLDLREVEVPCLPPNLSSQKHFVLNGNFCLQMMQVMDISKPKLWQLQKIKNSSALTRQTYQDKETAGTGKRLLQLTLTDGVQEVEAMEYQPIPHININLAPGIKIRITGPVAVRRGRLMLEQQNIKVLGGEVEELLVSHAAENVLARSLKLPENPNPMTIEEKILTVAEEEVEGYTTHTKVSKPPPSHQTVPQPPVVNQNRLQGYTSNVKQSKPPPQQTHITSTITDEEEMMLAREVDMLLEAEQEVHQLKTNKSKTPDLFEDDFNDEDFNGFNCASTSTQVHKKSQPQNLPTSLMDGDDDVFNDIDIDAHLNALDKKSETQPLPGLTTIAKIKEMKDSITRGTFKVKAKFKTVVEKLTFDSNEYKLVIKIEDNTGDLVVRLHTDVVADFTGYSPADILDLKSSILSQDKTAVDKVLQGMQKVRDNLLKLDNVVVIEVRKNEVPVIIRIQ